MLLEDLTVELDSTWVDGPGVGQVPAQDLDLEITDVFNNVGKWKLTLPVEHPLAIYAQGGCRIRVTIPGPVCLFSGPLTLVTRETTTENPAGNLILEGVSDSILLADRVVFPEPSNPDPGTQTASHYVVHNVEAEDHMHRLVNVNLGPGAHVDRRDARVVMGTNGLRGPISTLRTRFNVLGERLAELAPLAGVGFRLIQSDYTTGNQEDIVFETYEPSDKTAEVRLDAENNTLSGSKAALGAPALTHVIVAGQDEGVDRQFLIASTPESEAAGVDWSRDRIEKFVDQRQTDDPTEHQRKADELLIQSGRELFTIQAVPAEHVQGFGEAWSMGDLVTVVLGEVEYAAVVNGYTLKANSDGFRIGCLIGDPGVGNPDALFGSTVRDTAQRVANLEKNLEVKVTPSLPDPSGFTFSTGGSTTITSTTWANVPGSITLGQAPPEDCIVHVELQCWLAVTAGAGSVSSIRVGISLDGAAPDTIDGGTHGQTLYASQPAAGTLYSAQHSTSFTFRLPAGTRTWNVKAMKTGTNPVSVSYGRFTVTRLRYV